MCNFKCFGKSIVVERSRTAGEQSCEILWPQLTFSEPVPNHLPIMQVHCILINFFHDLFFQWSKFYLDVSEKFSRRARMISISIRVRFCECHIVRSCNVTDKNTAFSVYFSDIQVVRNPGMK